jgi:hypothetical protein
MSIFDFLKEPDDVQYTEDPMFSSTKQNIGDFLNQAYATGTTPYSGQMTLQTPEVLSQGMQSIINQFQNPVTSKYYSEEPLQAMKESALSKAENDYRSSVIDPLQEKLVKYGISSSYGVDNPVIQAEQALQEQLGDLGTSYDVQIQNMLQQGQAFEQEAAQQNLANALSYGGIDMTSQQYDIGNLYNEFIRQQNYPYQTYLPTSLSYLNTLQPQNEALNQVEAYNATKQSPFEAMLPQVAGIALGTYMSDKNLKDIVNTVFEFDNGIKIVTFRWNEFAKKKYNMPEGIHIGVIAQDVQKVYPEFIKNKDGFLSVNYKDLFAKLLKEF